MKLSEKAKEHLIVGLANQEVGEEVAKAIDDAQSTDSEEDSVEKLPFVELSVNDAQFYIDLEDKLNWYNHVRTNQAGNFNGGGIGNKMICGLKGYNNGADGILITEMPKIEFQYETRIPSTAINASHPYVQGIANFDVQRIVSFDSTLNVGSPTTSNPTFGDSTLGTHSLKRTLISGSTFKAEIDISQNLMYIVVSGLAVNVLPGAVEGVHYVVQAGAGATNSPLYWTFVTYLPSAVQDLYPNAKFHDTYVTDGGAPKSKLMTGIYFGVGDSSTNTYFHNKVDYLKVNGKTII